jgi:hypothetical protein
MGNIAVLHLQHCMSGTSVVLLLVVDVLSVAGCDTWLAALGLCAPQASAG